MKNPNWNSISLKPGERLDELQRNGYVIIQDQERFCFAWMVFLSASPA
ncbi:MAG: hypothetical protein ACLVAW_15180 [Eisenbergiella massiliensis]